MPLMLLWVVALALPAVCDFPKLWQLSYYSVRYVLGLLRIMTCSVALAVVVAGAIALVARRAALRWLLAVPAVLAVTVYAFLMAHYGSRLTPEIYTFITETNRGEATEYLAAYLTGGIGLWLSVEAIVALSLWIMLDKWWHQRESEPSRCVGMVTATLLAAAIVGAVCAPTTWLLARSLIVGDKNRYYDSFGLEVISNVMFCEQATRYTSAQMRELIDATRKAVEAPPSCGEQAPTVVLVIGESYIKSHAGIYGYPLPTTPCMAREMELGRLWAFSDAVSPFNHTNMTMRMLFSLSSASHGEPWQQGPLVAALFKSSGYRVDLWDNQRDFYTGSDFARGLNGFLYHPEVIDLCYSNLNTRNYTHDAELVANYASSSAYGDTKPGLVILHLRGQHLQAAKRYPHGAGFDRFTPRDYSFRHEDFLTADMLQTIAHYDNATLYNDHVLGTIFELFCKRDAVVVYLSDHGDEVYDYRPTMGRRAAQSDDLRSAAFVQMLHYQFDVPLVVWCSPVFIERHAERVELISAASSRRVSIDDVGQMLLGVAGISTPRYDPECDVTNPEYTPVDRIVNLEFNYDALTIPH